MKPTTVTVVFAALCLGGIGDVLAGHGSHASVGVVIGPYWGPWYSPPPPSYYYAPYYAPSYPPVVVERVAPVYLERQTPQSLSAPIAPIPGPQTNFWYYCRTAKGYYPYVRECPGGWQKVLPKPPGQP